MADQYTPEPDSLSAALLAHVANSQAKDLRTAKTRATQLENALRALLAVIDDPSSTEVGIEQAADEARALLDGDVAPADTEDPDA